MFYAPVFCGGKATEVVFFLPWEEEEEENDGGYRGNGNFVYDSCETFFAGLLEKIIAASKI